MSGGQFGFQSANAVIFFIVIVVISVAQMTITGKKEEQLVMKKSWESKGIKLACNDSFDRRG